MKKSACLFCLLGLLIYCGPKQADVERIMEDGVEVVLNHLEPYQIKEEAVLSLEQEYILDLEREDLAELGISDISGFDVDSDGFIYFWSWDTSDKFIYKFDENGNFKDSLGRKGQGPGELELPGNLRINDFNELVVADSARSKIVYFNTEGELLREVQCAKQIFVATQLSNENILVMNPIFSGESGYGRHPIVLSTVELKEIKELHRGQKFSNWARASEINGINTVPNMYPWSISNGYIFVGNVENGYELLVYDFEGQLLKKIKKEYVRVEVPQELKDMILTAFDQSSSKKYKEKVFFPEYMPPFQYFFSDDESRLYVMTCEKGLGKNEYIYDIFNSDGYFTGRISLDNFGNAISSERPYPLLAVAKSNRLYHLREKESGFIELVINKMIWQ